MGRGLIAPFDTRQWTTMQWQTNTNQTNSHDFYTVMWSVTLAWKIAPCPTYTIGISRSSEVPYNPYSGDRSTRILLCINYTFVCDQYACIDQTIIVNTLPLLYTYTLADSGVSLRSWTPKSLESIICTPPNVKTRTSSPVWFFDHLSVKFMAITKKYPHWLTLPKLPSRSAYVFTYICCDAIHFRKKIWEDTVWRGSKPMILFHHVKLSFYQRWKRSYAYSSLPWYSCVYTVYT